jgi:D-tyrosyl-tRNA(Tyr) deacylase
MIAVVQRVSRAAVTIDELSITRSIGVGVVILLGVVKGDSQASAAWLAEKIAVLRIFPDDEGKMNRSLIDIRGAALVISQFTLAGDCRKGTRPSFDQAEQPEKARTLYEFFASSLKAALNGHVEMGEFGAHMDIALINDGPVTLILEHPRSAD